MAGSPVPARLAREGDLMLVALVADLLELPQVEVSYARDARLAPLLPGRSSAARACWRGPHEAPHAALTREIAAAEAVWPIAPETGGALETAARAVLDGGRILLGPRPEAIRLTARKSATAQHLQRAGIDVVACFEAAVSLAAIEGPWVVKPDDGAGCVDTRIFASRQEAANALRCAADGHIAQPWIEGDAMSLCVLAAPGGVEVVSVNRQHLELKHGSVELAAIDVNCESVTPPLAALAERVVAAIPGLVGYFGIDFVRTASGPVVIEINPRLTSSYAALRTALGLNVAERVLAAAMDRPVPAMIHRGRSVRLALNSDGFG
jgi:tyramine---L-glutamate ligase